VVLGEEFPALVSGVTEVDVTLFSAELVEEEVAVDFVEHGVVFAGGGGFAFDVASVAFLPDVDSEGLVVPAACDLVVEARVVDVYKLDEVEFVVYSCSFSLVVVSGARCPLPSLVAGETIPYIPHSRRSPLVPNPKPVSSLENE